VSNDTLILVDEDDRELGYASKESCHEAGGRLHRAFSVLVFDGPAMLITKRSARKRTWPLYWSNACCGHPRPGESCASAAARRLQEELGIAGQPIFLYKFRYQATFTPALAENEVDWVFKAEHSGPVYPQDEEVADYRLVDLSELERDMRSDPARYTPWFRIIVLEHGLARTS